MGRSPCCSKEAGLNRGSWTALEDKILTDYIKIHGEGRWRNLPQKAGLKRCGKSCRLRWLNYLRPDIKRGNISPDEEELIIRLHKLLGNRWSLIAGRLPGRTDNEIKNYWNTNLGKKVHLHHQSINTCSTAKIAKDIVPCGPSKAENPSLSPGLATPPSPGRVIRTRAVKCTKVLLNDGGRGDVSDKDAAPRGAPSTAFSEGNFDNSSGADPGLGPDIGAGGCDIGNVVIPSCAGSDANFDVDELFLADLPMNSEFIRRDEYFRDFSYVTMSNNAIASKDFHRDNHDRYDHDFLFSEELTLPDWTSSGNNNVGVLKEQCVGPINYCSSFSSFLGSEGDWLAAD